MIISSISAQEILEFARQPHRPHPFGARNDTPVSASFPPVRPARMRQGELRDGDKSRYGGKGVLKAVANVNDADCAQADWPRPD